MKVQEPRLATGGGVAQQGEEDLVDVGARGRVEQDGVVLVADFGGGGNSTRAPQCRRRRGYDDADGVPGDPKGVPQAALHGCEDELARPQVEVELDDEAACCL